MTGVPVAEAIARATERLAAAGVDSARYDAEELAAHLLGVRRGALATQTAIDPVPYGELVERRVQREPLQHLTGVAGFRYLDIQVGPGALVPRPETELVAGAAIDAARAVTGRSPIVVDLGTGTGAIALAVASEVPGARVHAVEPSAEAMAWAERNVAASGVALELHRATAAQALPQLDGAVDVVVSNPPYLPDGTTIGPEVQHDPAAALWGGPEGLDVVREVVAAAARLLRPGGVLVVEHDPRHAPAVLSLLSTPEWTGAQTFRDLTGRDRYATARRTS